MSYREILRILSSYFYLYGGILCLPFLLSAYYQFRIELNIHPQIHSTAAFAYTFVFCLGLAWLCAKGAGKIKSVVYRQREAIASVVIIWFLTPAIGALPFFLSGTLEHFDQAYFEAASGFTTTGATIIEAKQYDPQTGEEIPIQRTYCSNTQDITYRFYGTVKPVKDPLTGELLEGLEAVSPALLFWRSLMQWLGGMGIIVLFVAFLPELGVKGKFLFQTETPGPLKESFKPRIKETALQLWKIYLGLTLLEILLLLITNPNMLFFDAITLAFSTLSTGGFSVHNENIGYYQHTATEWVVMLFMILGSVNFSIYYSVLKGKFYRLFDAELICFLLTLAILGYFVAWHLRGVPDIALTGEVKGAYSYADALRIGLFQLVSTQTSSGFFIANYDTWPFVVQVVLLISMYLGGMSGSTAGGLKMIRIQILFQILKTKIESIFQPKRVKITRVGEREIDTSTSISVLCFFFIAIVASAIGTFLYVWDHIDLETSLGLTSCMLNNTGIGFRAAGAASTMAFLSSFSSYLSSFLMILGRLEYYAVLTILLPAFWRDD